MRSLPDVLIIGIAPFPLNIIKREDRGRETKGKGGVKCTGSGKRRARSGILKVTGSGRNG